MIFFLLSSTVNGNSTCTMAAPDYSGYGAAFLAGGDSVFGARGVERSSPSPDRGNNLRPLTRDVVPRRSGPGAARNIRKFDTGRTFVPLSIAGGYGDDSKGDQIHELLFDHLSAVLGGGSILKRSLDIITRGLPDDQRYHGHYAVFHLTLRFEMTIPVNGVDYDVDGSYTSPSDVLSMPHVYELGPDEMPKNNSMSRLLYQYAASSCLKMTLAGLNLAFVDAGRDSSHVISPPTTTTITGWSLKVVFSEVGANDPFPYHHQKDALRLAKRGVLLHAGRVQAKLKQTRRVDVFSYRGAARIPRDGPLVGCKTKKMSHERVDVFHIGSTLSEFTISYAEQMHFVDVVGPDGYCLLNAVVSFSKLLGTVQVYNIGDLRTFVPSFNQKNPQVTNELLVSLSAWAGFPIVLVRKSTPGRYELVASSHASSSSDDVCYLLLRNGNHVCNLLLNKYRIVRAETGCLKKSRGAYTPRVGEKKQRAPAAKERCGLCRKQYTVHIGHDCVNRDLASSPVTAMDVKSDDEKIGDEDINDAVNRITRAVNTTIYDLDLDNMNELSAVCVSAPAGTGKTSVFTKTLLLELAKKDVRIVVTALTHLALSRIDVPKSVIATKNTPYSLFGINYKKLQIKPEQHKNIVEYFEKPTVIVFDECSFCGDKLWDLLMNQVFCYGNVKLVMIGDVLQLPPISRDVSRSRFFFESSAWRSIERVSYIGDSVFNFPFRFIGEDDPHTRFKLLGAMRTADLLSPCLGDYLRSKYLDSCQFFSDDGKVSIEDLLIRDYKENPGFKIVSTTNALRKQINEAFISCICLPGVAPLPFRAGGCATADGIVCGLRAGVPLITTQSYANEVDTGVEVTFTMWLTGGVMLCHRGDGQRVLIKKDDGLGYYPVQLAWCITIHKSQGSTYPGVRIIMSKAQYFGPGQLFVAASRSAGDVKYFVRMQNVTDDLKTNQLYAIDMFKRNLCADAVATNFQSSIVNYNGNGDAPSIRRVGPDGEDIPDTIDLTSNLLLSLKCKYTREKNPSTFVSVDAMPRVILSVSSTGMFGMESTDGSATVGGADQQYLIGARIDHELKKWCHDYNSAVDAYEASKTKQTKVGAVDAKRKAAIKGCFIGSLAAIKKARRPVLLICESLLGSSIMTILHTSMIFSESCNARGSRFSYRCRATNPDDPSPVSLVVYYDDVVCLRVLCITSLAFSGKKTLHSIAKSYGFKETTPVFNNNTQRYTRRLNEYNITAMKFVVDTLNKYLCGEQLQSLFDLPSPTITAACMYAMALYELPSKYIIPKYLVSATPLIKKGLLADDFDSCVIGGRIGTMPGMPTLFMSPMLKKTGFLDPVTGGDIDDAMYHMSDKVSDHRALYHFDVASCYPHIMKTSCFPTGNYRVDTLDHTWDISQEPGIFFVYCDYGNDNKKSANWCGGKVQDPDTGQWYTRYDTGVTYTGWISSIRLAVLEREGGHFSCALRIVRFDGKPARIYQALMGYYTDRRLSKDPTVSKLSKAMANKSFGLLGAGRTVRTIKYDFQSMGNDDLKALTNFYENHQAVSCFDVFNQAEGVTDMNIFGGAERGGPEDDVDPEELSWQTFNMVLVLDYMKLLLCELLGDDTCISMMTDSFVINHKGAQNVKRYLNIYPSVHTSGTLTCNYRNLRVSPMRGLTVCFPPKILAFASATNSSYAVLYMYKDDNGNRCTNTYVSGASCTFIQYWRWFLQARTQTDSDMKIPSIEYKRYSHTVLNCRKQIHPMCHYDSHEKPVMNTGIIESNVTLFPPVIDDGRGYYFSTNMTHDCNIKIDTSPQSLICVTPSEQLVL